jgi:beta-D-xylosidase 4
VHWTDEIPFASNAVLPITSSCSFNRSLWRSTANQIGREGRAFTNINEGDSTFWAPVINIVRDPRWGRNLETAGEDPFVSGEYAVSWVHGFQTASESPFPMQASSCCKHFVANELDGWNGTDRNHIDVFVPQQDLVDSYLPSFQACVQEGQVSGIMCSCASAYPRTRARAPSSCALTRLRHPPAADNSVNGVPSCANDWLLTTLLRKSWQFDGYVTTDCDAASDVYNSHHYTATPEEAVKVILNAGTDVDCGGFMTQYAQSALDKGIIAVADLDAALQRLFRVRLRLGHFDPVTSSPVYTIGPQDVCNPYAQELMRDGARQSAVLLKNDGGLLPLKLSAVTTALAVGPNVDLSDTFHYYAGSSCNGTYHVPHEAISQYVPGTVVLKGVPDVGSGNTSGVAAAAAAAAASDLVVLMVGSDLMLEQEGHDRTSIDFSDGQKALIAAVTAASKNPVVALVMSGGAMDVSSLLANPKIGAIIHCGQMSTQIVGVGDVIFGATPDGRAVAPAARMSQMTYPADYVNQVSMFDCESSAPQRQTSAAHIAL